MLSVGMEIKHEKRNVSHQICMGESFFVAAEPFPGEEHALFIFHIFSPMHDIPTYDPFSRHQTIAAGFNVSSSASSNRRHASGFCSDSQSSRAIKRDQLKWSPVTIRRSAWTTCEAGNICRFLRCTLSDHQKKRPKSEVTGIWWISAVRNGAKHHSVMGSFGKKRSFPISGLAWFSR